MAENKSIMLYLDTFSQWKMLSDSQAGILIKALLAYAADGEQPETNDGMVLMAFSFIRQQIDRDAEKYEKRCDKNRQIALEREARKRNSTNVHERAEDSTKSTDTNTDTNTDTDTKKKSADKPQTHANEINEVVQHLNAKAGTNYRPSSASTQRHLNARFAEGFTVADCKSVIDKKCAEWKGTEFEKFLRPETLFGSKFESYLNAQAHSRGRPQQPAHSSINMEDVEKLFNQCGIKAQL